MAIKFRKTRSWGLKKVPMKACYEARASELEVSLGQEKAWSEELEDENQVLKEKIRVLSGELEALRRTREKMTPEEKRQIHETETYQLQKNQIKALTEKLRKQKILMDKYLYEISRKDQELYMLRHEVSSE